MGVSVVERREDVVETDSEKVDDEVVPLERTKDRVDPHPPSPLPTTLSKRTPLSGTCSTTRKPSLLR